jgi:hypothetical protein
VLIRLLKDQTIAFLQDFFSCINLIRKKGKWLIRLKMLMVNISSPGTNGRLSLPAKFRA